MAAETNDTDLLAGTLDIDSDSAPVVARDRLYRLWEEGHWSVNALDFAQDIRDWRENLTETQRRAVLWSYASFLDGEESVTVTLAPFVAAARRPEDRVFLATQIADEARHHVFFDRWLREVAGIGDDLTSTLRLTQADLSWGYRQVFSELDRVAARMHRAPGNLALLAQGIALYHIVIEGMLAHTGQHYFREFGTTHHLFPGFAEGIAHVIRDESRHIAFGIQLLRELVAAHPACKVAAIALLNRVLPWATGAVAPPNLDWSYPASFGFSHHDIIAFGIRSLETKLRRAGIEPAEVLALVKLGHDDPPEEQAARVVTLLEGGVIGTDGEMRVTEATLDAIFSGVQNAATWAYPKHPTLRASVQWLFADAAPRHLILTPVAAPHVAMGEIEHPTVTLRCAAADWARIAGGRLSQHIAVVSRRLRIAGDWALALRLGEIIPA